MATAPTPLLLRHIRHLATGQSYGQWSDRQLLERFASQRDEAAFSALLRRHGAMVFRVSRRVLGNWHDAEDVFQAAFLLLAQKAASARWQESVANWLYEAAYHLALKAKTAAVRRSVYERRIGSKAQEDPLADLTGRELQAVLDQELARLPEKYRAPLVLCYLEGNTRDEAAQRLRLPVSTLRLRLEQGRNLLRSRLARRGLVLSTALSAALLTENNAQATVSAALVSSTARAALGLAAGKATAALVSAPVAALMGEGLKALYVPKLKVAVALLLAVSVLTTGAGLLTHQVFAGKLTDSSQAEATQPPPKKSNANERPESGRLTAVDVNKQVRATSPGQGEADLKEKMTVTGRVMDANEKPLANAQVAIQGLLKNAAHPAVNLLDEKLLAHTRTGADGRFRLLLPRPTLAEYLKIYALAGHVGNGLAWEAIQLDAARVEIVLRLPREKIIRGRLLDLQGQPASGVKVHVSWLGIAFPRQMGTTRVRALTKEASSIWPSPAMSDNEGKFMIRGLNPNHHGYVFIESDHFAPHYEEIKTGKAEMIQEVNVSLAPAQIVEGVLTAADTSKPLPHARLSLNSGDNPDSPIAMGPGVSGEADEQGRFHLNPPAGKMFTIRAAGPEGQPYLRLEKSFKWPKGAVKHRVNLALPKGVLVRGRVTEAGSGKLIAGVIVRDTVGLWLNPSATTGPDGTFQIAVAPGPGHLLIKGPDNDFIPVETTHAELEGRKPSGHRLYPDAVVPLNLKPGSDAHEISVQLRRGVTIKGTLLKPDGKPPTEAVMLCWSQVPQHAPTWFDAAVSVHNGQFEVRGCDPDKTYTVHFLDAKNELGATAKLSFKETRTKPVTVRLSPCGSAEARFVDKQGNPLPAFRPIFYIVARPGPRYSDKEPSADSDFVANVDRLHYSGGGSAVDKEGRGKYPCLIPGATYRILDYDLNSVKDFSVEPGQALKLGDRVIYRPQ